ncbi:biotin/lipoyl-binding protein [Anaerolineae bacterium CFX9]|nr:biotin/lipoyl-binding protein [Anaerolineae bacterium CFX9]
MKYVTKINDQTFEIEIQKDGSLLVNGEPRQVDFLTLGPSLYSVIMENQSYELVIEPGEEGIQVQMRGNLYTGEVLDERAQLMAMQRGGQVTDSGEISIKSPMPGLIVALPFAEGESVSAGQTIIILESMKMQNELKAPRAGVISRVHVQVGQSVEQNAVLISLS